jgi:Metallo-peptidase family M12B Reprolysin-like/CHRD domain/Secretion system C-terminal sorting domain
LSRAPMELTPEARNSSLILELPMPDNQTQKFRVFESPTMDKELAKQFPEIKTYAGTSISNEATTIRFDITPAGFHAMVLSSEGIIYIDPYSRGTTDFYIVYNKKDFVSKKVFSCGFKDGQGLPTIDDKKTNDSPFNPNPAPPPTENNSVNRIGNCAIRTYRLALSATGEYTAFHGGTVALALAAQVTTMNRVNGVFLKDFAVRMNIIANNNLIIYTNAANDPFTNGNPNAMIGQNQTNTTTVIGSANYDIGHVFGTNSGGLAGLGVVCNSGNKARGVTGSGSPIGDPFDIDYVAHEIGHQFSGNHSFNNSCDGNRNSATAWEPGSGSTIMSYAGICAPNVQPNSDAFFHGGNLTEMHNFINAGGNTCASLPANTNAFPTITSSTSAQTIPRGTPILLESAANDADGNGTLTYCWEQMDNQISTQAPLSTSTGGPNFRSFNPSLNSSRYMPRLSDLAVNAVTTWEVLPTVARTLNFRLVVRDNAVAGGCNDHVDVALTVDGNSGPLAVTLPNATGLTWAGATNQTVTWDVANTTAAPVSCATVDILLSTDGGLTFPTVLATNVANSGTASVVAPNIATTTARVMVRGSGRAFFDISNNNFAITALICTAPTVSCPGNIVQNNTKGFCDKEVTYTTTTSGSPAPTVSFAFTGATFANGSGNGSDTTFNVGVTNVTVTVANTCGSSSCSFTVTINDTEAPTVTKGTIASCYATVAAAEAAALAATSATDNCPGTLTKTASTVGTCSAVITVTTTDGAGNSAQVTYNTRIDNTAPTATIGTISSCYPSVAAAEAAASAATSATDNCPGALTETASTVGTCSAVVTVTTTDGCGNATDVTYNTRIDNTAPTVTVGTIGSCYPTVAAAQAAALAATSATDNCPGALTEVASTVGTCSAVITVTTTDGCGNATAVTYNTRIDNTAPTVTVGTIASSYPSVSAAEAAALAATSATDNCPGAFTETVSTVGTCSAVITVTTTDGCGNATAVTYNTRINIDLDLPIPSVTDISCKSNSDGKIVAMATGSTGITYSIAPNIGTQSPSGTFNGLTPQTYTVTAMNQEGCTASNVATVGTSPLPIVDAGLNQTICQGSSTSITANCNLLSINATLTGASEVPANASTATGIVTGTFNKVTNQLNLKVVFNGLTSNASASHIHIGAVGANGGVIVGFSGVPAAKSGTFTYSGVLSAANATALLAGNTYVNVHNASFPGGEIRGQISTPCIANNFVWNPGALSGQTVSVSPLALTTYTVTASNTLTGCSATASVTISVDIPPVGGTLAASKNGVCRGESVQLSLNGIQGSVMQWEKQPNCTGDWLPIVTSTTDSTIIPTEKICYRVKVVNGICPAAFSDIASIAVDQPAAGGIVALATNTLVTKGSICPNTNINLKVSGYTGKVLNWQFNPIASPAWINIANTSGLSAYTVYGSSLTMTTFYRAIICSELGLCTGTKAVAYSSPFKVSLKSNCAPPPPTPSLASQESVPTLMTLVKAYPIPSNSRITLEIDGATEGVTQIEILDLTGKVVQRSSQNVLDGFNELTLDIQNLSKGLYLVKVKDSSHQEAVLKVSKM